MELKESIDAAIETLEALYFFTQGLDGQAGQHLAEIRAMYRLLISQGYLRFLRELRDNIAAVRIHYGAIAPDQTYRGLLREAREALGKIVYISKLQMERELFLHYEKSIVRWRHIKLHAFVVFDPTMGFLNQMFEMDGQLFHDAQFLLHKARTIQGGVRSQRELPQNRHRVLHTTLRALVTTLFTFMEAYLNGIAFDCFMKNHDRLELDDHDLLGEWNSAKKRRKFVAFDDKVLKYPRVAAKMAGREIDLSAFQPAQRIISEGKDTRDAITHPSAQYDPELQVQKKLTLLAGLTLPALESLYADMCEYVRFVEEGTGNNTAESVPWLFDERGFISGREETI